jgi:hypothetical protein
MNTLTEFELAQGGSILVESSDPQVGGNLTPVSATELVQRAQDTFETAVDKLRPAIDYLNQQLTAFRNSPDNVELEFGIKLTAAAGAIIASAGTEANFKVKLCWKKSEAPTS